MDYKQGGYSWLGVTPETEKEEQIEKLEDQIYALHKELKKSGKTELLDQIHILEDRIKKIQNKP